MAELERLLLERGASGPVTRDTGELLRAWQALGIHGIPQGVPQSAPLGNLYLSPIDQALERNGIEFVRYMDDMWLFADNFAGARRAQDLLEPSFTPLG